MPIGAFMSLPGSNPSHIWPYLQSVMELGHSTGHRLRSKVGHTFLVAGDLFDSYHIDFHL